MYVTTKSNSIQSVTMVHQSPNRRFSEQPNIEHLLFSVHSTLVLNHLYLKNTWLSSLYHIINKVVFTPVHASETWVRAWPSQTLSNETLWSLRFNYVWPYSGLHQNQTKPVFAFLLRFPVITGGFKVTYELVYDPLWFFI